MTDQQVRKLMEELNRHGQLGKAALRAGMDRKTARKYRNHGNLPSELKKPRTWRTRKDPFEPEDWALAKQMLWDAPELESKALFTHIAAQRPGRYEPGQLRSFQRRVKRWRATECPDKTVFFAQDHPPGEALQLDFTHASSLGVRIVILSGQFGGHPLREEHGPPWTCLPAHARARRYSRSSREAWKPRPWRVMTDQNPEVWGSVPHSLTAEKT